MDLPPGELPDDLPFDDLPFDDLPFGKDSKKDKLEDDDILPF
jgi:hypothetical protein